MTSPKHRSMLTTLESATGQSFDSNPAAHQTPKRQKARAGSPGATLKCRNIGCTCGKYRRTNGFVRVVFCASSPPLWRGSRHAAEGNLSDAPTLDIFASFPFLGACDADRPARLTDIAIPSPRLRTRRPSLWTSRNHPAVHPIPAPPSRSASARP